MIKVQVHYNLQQAIATVHNGLIRNTFYNITHLFFSFCSVISKLLSICVAISGIETL